MERHLHLRLLEFQRTLLLVNASRAEDLSKSVKKYKQLLLPEAGQDLERSSEQTKKLLAKEFDRGPLQVQALDYGKRKRRKRR